MDDEIRRKRMKGGMQDGSTHEWVAGHQTLLPRSIRQILTAKLLRPLQQNQTNTDTSSVRNVTMCANGSCRTRQAVFGYYFQRFLNSVGDKS